VEAPPDSVEVAPTYGLVAKGNRLIGFDGALSRISILDDAYSIVNSFGREGQGPGEFAPPHRSEGAWPRGTRADWIDARNDSVFVFDGSRLQVFSTEGRLLEPRFRLEAVLQGRRALFSSRIRLTGSTILLDVERQGGNPQPGVADGRSFTIWRVPHDGEPEVVWSMPLQVLPKTDRGSNYFGPTEAYPVWDTQNGCLVVSNGGLPFLVVGSIKSGRFDTLGLRLPPRAPQRVAEVEELLAKSGDPARVPDPVLPRRIRRLVISPDGWIWIEPVQPANLSGLEVIRVNLATSQQRTDTVPFFPSFFGQPGEIFSVARLNNGSYAIRRTTTTPAR
jgi:hypothetical protein